MARASNRILARAARLAGALALASLCAACGSMDPGYSIVTQDKFDFMTCREIVGHRDWTDRREKELAELTEKAEFSPRAAFW